MKVLVFILLSFLFFINSSYANTLRCAPLFSDRPLELHEVTFATGNPTKISLIKKFLKKMNLKARFLDVDAREIDSKPIDVAVHKASQAYRDKKITIIEDTSLHIEGANIGPRIKWHIQDLPLYIGRKASFEVVYAFLHQGKVYVFSESLDGRILDPNTKSETARSLEPYFYPRGSNKSMKELKENGHFDRFDPRLRALERVYRLDYDTLRDPIWHWHGAWQGN